MGFGSSALALRFLFGRLLLQSLKLFVPLWRLHTLINYGEKFRLTRNARLQLQNMVLPLFWLRAKVQRCLQE
ncbi:hypothetical protein R69776_01137 [Paraburkholderia nemoris]|uniref:Uncharacterized protein n=1 Tax=Paraburkholderia nemoris TaxID=2793076 RepID=A0ABN7KTB1_9BURK|nr:hypothetical protein R69776_01137 [Paraburkholderia nemoris]